MEGTYGWSRIPSATCLSQLGEEVLDDFMKFILLQLFSRMNLTLSRCSEDEFTCNDGVCIDSSKRCDLVQDCVDFSDELECTTVRVLFVTN